MRTLHAQSRFLNAAFAAGVSASAIIGDIIIPA